MGAQAVLSAGVILLGPIEAGRWASDHFNYHEPTIRLFAEQMFDPGTGGLDLSDYGSATTPGYHLLLALLLPIFGSGRVGLMLAGSAFTIGLVGLLSRLLIVRAGVRTGVALTLPVMASQYVFPASVWLLPDNAGWLGVLAVLGLALHARCRVRLVVLGGLMLIPLVLFRQVHLWAAAVLWAAAWLGPPVDADAPDSGGVLEHPIDRVRELFIDWPIRAGWMAIAVAASLPAFGVIAWFARVWDGLVPPRFQGMYHGANPATPALTLSVLGLVAPAFMPFIWRGIRDLWKQARWMLLAAIGVGLLAAVIPATTFDPDAGRISGIWTIANRLPEIGGRTSPIVVVLAPIGAVAVVGLLRRVNPRTGWVLLGALVAFVVAQSATHEAWQRYHEPFVLMWLALASAAATRAGERSPTRAALVFPLGVALVMAVATGVRIGTATHLPRLEPEALERVLDADPLDGRPPQPSAR